MTKRKWAILTGVVLLLVAAAVGLAARIYEADSLPPQPIAFNHRLHLERVQGIACPDCHQFVGSQTYAGLPSKYVCFGCHDPEAEPADPAAQAAKPVLARLLAFARTDRDIPWQRVTSLRPDVFFSHRRHVTVAKLDCRLCHAEMPGRTSPPTRGPMTMKMATCLECHGKNHASVDCVSCHR